ncbi:MAG: beta-ketoacyl-ACP synthase II [Chloroflexota bacterium]|nr:MAG: beta-ketoacyl-ACP synthase II [Chloroflexota bacterium]
MSTKRVVITGLGAISPLGTTLEGNWNNLLEGRSGIRKISQFDADGLPCQIAGEIPDFDPTDYIEKKEVRRLARSAQIALAAAKNAVNDAALPEIMPEPERSAVYFGTGIGGLDVFEENNSIFHSRGYSRVNPFALPGTIPNMPAFAIGREFQCLGPNFTITTACATGTQAIGEACELIRRGVADIVLSGGTEAMIRDFAIVGFIAMRALPTSYNDNPTKASRPFDLNREGFIFSEGAGVLVLEELEHALKRGARIYAEVAGHAASSDGFHMAAPDPDGAGPTRAMRWALQDAKMNPDEIDYINAHGSSTALNDSTETRAIKAVFGQQAYKIPVSSTKSMMGHAMGASGALEAIFCTLTINKGWIPPTINYETPDPECDLDYVPNKARQVRVNTTLSNSFGLGGQNACLVLKRFED